VRIDLLQQTSIRLSWVGPLLLNPAEVARIPCGIPGVYLLHAFAPELGGYPVWYAGRSRDLRRRLSEHLGDRTAKIAVRAARELDRAYWSAAPVMDPSLLAPVEAALINALRPICNDQIPPAEPVLVNLPPLSFRTTIA